MEIPKLINVKELQKLLNIGKDTAYSLVRRKDFPSIKFGREYRIVTDDIPEWINKQKKNK